MCDGGISSDYDHASTDPFTTILSLIVRSYIQHWIGILLVIFQQQHSDVDLKPAQQTKSIRVPRRYKTYWNPFTYSVTAKYAAVNIHVKIWSWAIRCNSNNLFSYWISLFVFMLTLCHNYFRVNNNNKNTKDVPQRFNKRKFAFGVFILLLVVVLWVVSSEMTKVSHKIH